MSPAVVLLHGFTHTGASWEPVVRALDQRYMPVAPDIRGHGSAWDREPASLPAVIDDVIRSAPDRYALCGYSMGGRIALHVALARQPSVERLVLIGASPGIADQRERAARLAADQQLAEEIERLTMAEFAERWAANPVLAGQPASVRELVGADRLHNRPAGLARALRGLGTAALPSLWERLGELGMPVSLVVGERDQKFTAIAHQMAAAIPRANVVVVPGAGHAVHLEAPRGVADAIIGARTS